LVNQVALIISRRRLIAAFPEHRPAGKNRIAVGIQNPDVRVQLLKAHIVMIPCRIEAFSHLNDYAYGLAAAVFLIVPVVSLPGYRVGPYRLRVPYVMPVF